jgi:hypothetical protein
MSSSSSSSRSRSSSGNARAPSSPPLMWSGWPDLNRRPLDPQSSALTKLRHSPSFFRPSDPNRYSCPPLPQGAPPARRPPGPPESWRITGEDPGALGDRRFGIAKAYRTRRRGSEGPRRCAVHCGTLDCCSRNGGPARFEVSSRPFPGTEAFVRPASANFVSNQQHVDAGCVLVTRFSPSHCGRSPRPSASSSNEKLQSIARAGLRRSGLDHAP